MRCARLPEVERSLRTRGTFQFLNLEHPELEAPEDQPNVDRGASSLIFGVVEGNLDLSFTFALISAPYAGLDFRAGFKVLWVLRPDVDDFS